MISDMLSFNDYKISPYKEYKWLYSHLTSCLGLIYK